MDFMDSGQPNSFSSTSGLQGKFGLIWNGKKQRDELAIFLDTMFNNTIKEW